MNAKAKILDDKIKAEKVTHDLSQESTKISEKDLICSKS